MMNFPPGALSFLAICLLQAVYQAEGCSFNPFHLGFFSSKTKVPGAPKPDTTKLTDNNGASNSLTTTPTAPVTVAIPPPDLQSQPIKESTAVSTPLSPPPVVSPPPEQPQQITTAEVTPVLSASTTLDTIPQKPSRESKTPPAEEVPASILPLQPLQSANNQDFLLKPAPTVEALSKFATSLSNIQESQASTADSTTTDGSSTSPTPEATPPVLSPFRRRPLKQLAPLLSTPALMQALGGNKIPGINTAFPDQEPTSPKPDVTEAAPKPFTPPVSPPPSPTVQQFPVAGEEKPKVNYIEVEKLDVLNDYVKKTKTNNQLLVVYFWATDCKPCKSIVPGMLDDLAQELQGVTLLKINGDSCWNCVYQYDVQTYPSFFFYKNGEKVESLKAIYFDTKEKFRTFLNQYR